VNLSRIFDESRETEKRRWLNGKSTSSNGGFSSLLDEDPPFFVCCQLFHHHLLHFRSIHLGGEGGENCWPSLAVVAGWQQAEGNIDKSKARIFTIENHKRHTVVVVLRLAVLSQCTVDSSHPSSFF
jgi:hypothetical protein